MTKKKRDVRAEHEKAVADFAAQPEPDIWVCFYWPAVDRWQAIAAHEMHRPLVEEMRSLIREARGADAPESMVAGDAMNALAEMVLNQHDVPRMGALLLIAKDFFKAKYLFAISKREHHGSTVDVKAIPAKTLVQARAWVDAHPDIVASKARLMASLLKGPQH